MNRQDIHTINDFNKRMCQPTLHPLIAVIDPVRLREGDRLILRKLLCRLFQAYTMR